jgi:hypothetical protein
MANESPSHELLKAIKTKWLATSALTTYFAGPYRNEAPYSVLASGTPYALIDIDSSLLGTTGSTAGGSERWDHTVTLEIRDDKETDVTTGLNKIKAILNTKTLMLTLGNSHSLESLRLVGETNRQNDKKVWVGKLTFKIVTNCPR